MKKIITLLFISVFMASCASYKPVSPAQPDAERAAQKFPGTTLTDLQQGKSIFEHSCKKCHSLKRPFTKSEATIKDVLPKMAQRAKLDNKQQDLVLKYLLTMNSVAKAK